MNCVWRSRRRSSCCDSTARLERAVESAEIGIGFGDSTGRIFWVNAAFTRISGYSRDDLLKHGIGWNELTRRNMLNWTGTTARLQDTGSAGLGERVHP